MVWFRHLITRITLGLMVITSAHTYGTSQSNAYLDSLARLCDTQADQLANGLDTTYIWNLNRTVEQMAYSRDNRMNDYIQRFADYTKQFTSPLATGLYLRARARIEDRSGLFNAALDDYTVAIDSLKIAKIDPGELAMTYVHMAFLISNSGSPDQCIKILEQARPYAEASDYALPLYYILDYLGDYNYYSAFQVEDYPKALGYYEQAKKLIEKDRLEGKRADNYAGLANVYYRLKNNKLADHYWHLADSLAQAEGNVNYRYGLYIDKSEILLDQGKDDDAIDLAQNAYVFAKETGWPELIARSENQLYWTYRSTGNFEKALDYFEKYSNTQDSMNKQELLNRYSELEAKYNNEKNAQLITELNNKNLKQTRNFLVGILILSFILVSIAYWANVRLREKNKLLLAKNKEILEAQIKGQTMERQRVASELHDNLNTKVAAIRWQLQALEDSSDEKNQKIITNSLKLINDVYSDIRFISHNLMPDEIESIGIIPALSNLINQLNSSNRVAFNLIADIDEFKLPQGYTYPVYNITFELINNVLKHANADHAWISLSKTDKEVVITVKDDGKGFQMNEANGGVGLKNVRSRVEHLNGTINITSSPGQGTKSTIQIPIS
ncbi:MAG: hypothetical protein H6570_13300 [Lewinellaceae bacterium]|nr:hypothetical protein [Lewinellaceae bacterium]